MATENKAAEHSSREPVVGITLEKALPTSAGTEAEELLSKTTEISTDRFRRFANYGWREDSQSADLSLQITMPDGWDTKKFGLSASSKSRVWEKRGSIMMTRSK